MSKHYRFCAISPPHFLSLSLSLSLSPKRKAIIIGGGGVATCVTDQLTQMRFQNENHSVTIDRPTDRLTRALCGQKNARQKPKSQTVSSPFTSLLLRVSLWLQFTTTHVHLESSFLMTTLRGGVWYSNLGSRDMVKSNLIVTTDR